MYNKINEYMVEKYPKLIFISHTEKIGNANIHAFFVKYNSYDELLSTWRKISNSIAIKFQTQIKDPFGKWNTYLFYLSETTIKKDLKYKIENDTFSNRKIVVENYKNELNSMNAQGLCDEHIGAQGIQLTISQKPFKYRRDFVIANESRGAKINWKKNKSASDRQLKELYNQIKKELKHEN